MKNQSSIRCIKDSAGCDVSTTFPDPIVNDHCLGVHPMIETVEFMEIEKLPGNKSTGPVLERIEHTVLNSRMFCQGCKHLIL